MPLSAQESPQEPRRRWPTLFSAFLPVVILLACNAAPSEPAKTPAKTPDQAGERDLQARCEAAVSHMSATIAGAGGEPLVEPSEAEAAIIAAVTQASIATCIDEGLSAAQAECILQFTGVASFQALRECPAIRERQPSWLILPPEDFVEPTLTPPAP